MHRSPRTPRRPSLETEGRTAGRASWIVLAGLAVVLVGVVAWLLTTSGGTAPDGRNPTSRGPETATTRPRDRGQERPVDVAGGESPKPAGVADALKDAVERGDAAALRAAAAALRGRLRSDPAAWRAAVELLLADGTPAALRAALAVVLGTIGDPDPDPALRDALAKFGASPDFARAALIALGAAREPPDVDEVFDLADRPWGVEGPGSLDVTVKREIGDAAVRAPIVACLSRDEPAVRRAAALALRHSLAAPDARVAFAEALSTEKDDAVAQELGEALVQTARESGDAAERTRLFGVVLRRAGDAGSDGLRFRVEDDLGASRLGDDERRALADMAASSQSFAKRSFALTVLARAARADGDGAVRHARGLLDDALARDADPAVRDLAARLLAWLPAGDSSIALLAKTVVADGAWNVRFTAVETIAACAPPEVARKTLAAATQDQDSRVAARAKELAAALEAPR